MSVMFCFCFVLTRLCAIRSVLTGLVPLVEKCAEKGVAEDALLSLTPDAMSLLYAPDLFASGTGYSSLERVVGKVLSAVLRNSGTDELGPGPQIIVAKHSRCLGRQSLSSTHPTQMHRLYFFYFAHSVPQGSSMKGSAARFGTSAPRERNF